MVSCCTIFNLMFRFNETFYTFVLFKKQYEKTV